MYEDIEYDDEEYEYFNKNKYANSQGYKVELLTTTQTIEVDAGTTIRLPCEIDRLPSKK